MVWCLRSAPGHRLGTRLTPSAGLPLLRISDPNLMQQKGACREIRCRSGFASQAQNLYRGRGLIIKSGGPDKDEPLVRFVVIVSALLEECQLAIGEV